MILLLVEFFYEANAKVTQTLTSQRNIDHFGTLPWNLCISTRSRIYRIEERYVLATETEQKSNKYRDALDASPLIHHQRTTTQIAKRPTWGPHGADRTQVGPMVAPWILLSANGYGKIYKWRVWSRHGTRWTYNTHLMDGICAEYEADLLNANRLTERDYQWLSVAKTKILIDPLWPSSSTF